MLSKCANPTCSVPFRYLHEGKLFQIEVSREQERLTHSGLRLVKSKTPQHVEYFWLCDACARRMTVAYEGGFGVRAVPLIAFRAAS